MDSDAVVAKGNRAHDRLAGQGAAATSESIIETLHPEDRLRITVALSGRSTLRLLLHQLARHILIAERLGFGFRLQAHLFAQAVQNLLERDGTKAKGRQQVFRACLLYTSDAADE